MEKLGRYRLQEAIGQGGMAKVHRATLEGPMGYSKEVAIKLIPPELAKNQNNLRALVNEARIGGQLHDPNIVEVYELEQVDETWFIAMELVRGKTLTSLLQQCRATSARIPRAVALEIAMQIAAGLNHAHNFRTSDGQPAELIHRDLKPSNVMIGERGVVKIMDFGIARSSLNLYRTTTTGAVRGTPLYISPEQLQGLDLTPASDVFSFGVLLYELLTSEQLFVASEAWGVMQRVMEMSVEPYLEKVAKKDQGAALLLGRCLERDPGARIATAKELFEHLVKLREEDRSDLTVAEFVRYLQVAPVLDLISIDPGNRWRWIVEAGQGVLGVGEGDGKDSVSVRRVPEVIAADLEIFGYRFFGPVNEGPPLSSSPDGPGAGKQVPPRNVNTDAPTQAGPPSPGPVLPDPPTPPPAPASEFRATAPMPSPEPEVEPRSEGPLWGWMALGFVAILAVVVGVLVIAGVIHF